MSGLSVFMSGFRAESPWFPPTPPFPETLTGFRRYRSGFMSGFRRQRDLSRSRFAFVEPAWWSPPQPLLECVECHTVYRYDGVSGKCGVCGSRKRAIVVEPAEPLPVIEAPRRHTWKAESLRLRFEVFKRDGYRCQICGKAAADGARLEPDHRTPKSAGGADTMENLWTLCFECNRGKRDQSL